MKEAVHELKNRQTEREDEFDTFGKYIATELRSMSDPSAAQRVRFKLARCLMDAIENENNKQIFVVDENMVVSQILNPQQQHQTFIPEQQQ